MLVAQVSAQARLCSACFHLRDSTFKLDVNLAQGFRCPVAAGLQCAHKSSSSHRQMETHEIMHTVSIFHEEGSSILLKS